MKKLSLVLLMMLAACSTSKYEPVSMKHEEHYSNQTLVLDKEVQPMSRNEVIMAINECEANNTRAVMLIGKRKLNGFATDIVVDVSCAPKYR